VKGRNILIYDKQALGKRAFKQTGKLIPSGLPIEIATCITEWRQLAQVRIVPRLDGYMVEVVYEQQEEQAEVDKRAGGGAGSGCQCPGRPHQQ
jgi:putative transposase